MTLSKGDLEALLNSGAVADIFKAERAYAVLKTIGLNAAAINASHRNLGELFGTLQDFARTDALISVARLFDPPDKWYPTRCLRALLDDLDTNANQLPPIIERVALAKELTRLGMDAAGVARIAEAPDAEVTNLLVTFLRGRLEETHIVDAVLRVKTVRDKRIAHNEAAHQIEGPTWHAVLQLIALAKEVVGLVGWAYLNSAYMINGEYQPSSDAERPARAMERMLEQIGMSMSAARNEIAD